VQQASAKFGGTWYSQTASAFSGSSVKWAKTRNAWATYTFTGRTIALVSTLGSTRGKARIYVNGVSVGTIDLRASATGYRVVAWQKTWPTSAKRVVKVVVLGTAGRPRVDVDAFVVIR
jgi:hypothetical protein